MPMISFRIAADQKSLRSPARLCRDTSSSVGRGASAALTAANHRSNGAHPRPGRGPGRRLPLLPLPSGPINGPGHIECGFVPTSSLLAARSAACSIYLPQSFLHAITRAYYKPDFNQIPPPSVGRLLWDYVQVRIRVTSPNGQKRSSAIVLRTVLRGGDCHSAYNPNSDSILFSPSAAYRSLWQHDAFRRRRRRLQYAVTFSGHTCPSATAARHAFWYAAVCGHWGSRRDLTEPR